MLLDLETTVQVQSDDQNIETLIRSLANSVPVDYTGTQLIQVPASTEVTLNLSGINGLVLIAYESTEPIDISLFSYPTGDPQEGLPIYSGYNSHVFLRYFPGIPEAGSFYNHVKLKGNTTLDANVKVVYAGNLAAPTNSYNLL